MAELNKVSPFYDRPKIMENDHAFAIYDGFAVSKGHALVVPKKQVVTFFDLDFVILKIFHFYEKFHSRA